MTPREEAIARLRAALDRDSTCAWAIAPESVAHLLAAYDEAIANTSLPGYERLVAERDAAQERVDLDVDEFRRIKAEIDNLRCGLPPLTEDSARTLYALIAGICDRAVAAGRQRVPLIVQRDKAEAERDTARAALAETERERDRARADLAAIKAQQDEVLRAELLSLGRYSIEQKPNMVAIKARIERQMGRLAERRLAEGAPWGIDGQRDPDHPCDMFRNGKPSERNTCEGDGHALCNECGHYRMREPDRQPKPAGGAS